MQTIETQINKLEAIVAEIDRINADLKEHADDYEQFQNGIYKIMELIDEEDEDDYDYDSDSDISFTEEERELIESEEHYAFLKRYSLKPTTEMPFVPVKTTN
jgi:predicted  nucleic acid-binding Zn-ribbon protein